MRLGINFNFGIDDSIGSRKVIASMRSAERIGFASSWFFDTIGRGYLTPDPLIQVSVAAALTERIDVGTCILQVHCVTPWNWRTAFSPRNS